MTKNERTASAADIPTLSQGLLAALTGAADADASSHIIGLQRLSGGANMETWSFDLQRAGQCEALILRRLPGGAGNAAVKRAENPADESAAQSEAREAATADTDSGLAVGELCMADEAALLVAAGNCGVPVPAVRLVLDAGHALGQGYIMSRERGEALPFRLLVDDCYRIARVKLAFQCGATLGRIHQIPLASLPRSLPDHSGQRLFQRAQLFLDTHGNVSPVLQLALNWLRKHARREPRRTLVHGDFRMGNLLVDEQGLVAVLDWELAHLGDPVQDLGYLCANVWRFGAPQPVGGFGSYEDLLAGYVSVTGHVPSMPEIHYWQVHAALSWGMVCLLMLHLYRSGQDASLERAAVGRRLSEAEIDVLVLLEGELP